MSDSQQPSWMRDTPDFALLDGTDDYARYFNILTKSWTLLLRLYEQRGSADTYEARVVKSNLERLLFTVKALRMKYSYNPTDRRLLWVDVSESGFPNAQDVGNVSVDFIKRQERLRTLMPTSMLKHIALDRMIKDQIEPLDTLWELAERSYLEMLNDEKLFLPFNMFAEDIAIRPTKDKKVRSYSCAWSCYDFRTNRPYIHLLTFDQDKEESPLEQRKPNLLKLLDVLQAEGSRVPDVGILAMAIDNALEPIHPKILKRVGLGPLYTPLLLEEELSHQTDDPMLKPIIGDNDMTKQKMLLELFNNYAESDDVILCFTEEIVFSKEQRITRTSHVREVFYLPNDDPEAYARRASVIHKYVLLPHGVSQHLTPDIITQVPEFQNAQLMTYDNRGAIYDKQQLGEKRRA
jgi:hypothetical protein